MVFQRDAFTVVFHREVPVVVDTLASDLNGWGDARTVVLDRIADEVLKQLVHLRGVSITIGKLEHTICASADVIIECSDKRTAFNHLLQLDWLLFNSLCPASARRSSESIRPSMP